MKPITPAVAITAAAMVSSLVYASPTESPGQSILPNTREEVSQMIVRPKNQMELAKNLKFIFDHDLELQDEFYTQANLKDAFNFDAVVIDKSGNANEDRRISALANKLSAIFPQKRVAGNGVFVPTASLTAGKTIHASGEVSAGINFIIDEGGPTFDETWEIFNGIFTKLDPLFPGTYGQPLPARALHGNETWRYEWADDKTEKILTLGFSRDAALSNVLIEIKNKI